MEHDVDDCIGIGLVEVEPLGVDSHSVALFAFFYTFATTLCYHKLSLATRFRGRSNHDIEHCLKDAIA